VKVKIRPAVISDAESCARVMYEAFKSIARRHQFPSDLPTLEHAMRVVIVCVSHPASFGAVAERSGRVVGSCFIDKRDQIYGLGPVSVEPKVQARGIGRKLVEAALQHGEKAAGIRLVQDAFNLMSFSLYVSLGFEVKEPLALVEGRLRSLPLEEVKVRPLEKGDLDECEALCLKVHGFARTNELQDALNLSSAFVLLRQGCIKAYTSGVALWGHGVAETEADMKGLLLGVEASRPQPLRFIAPMRLNGFFRWCLSEGLRVVKPMTLMAMGRYLDPKGCYFPSASY